MDLQVATQAVERQDAAALDRALDGDSFEGLDCQWLHAAAGVLMGARHWEKAAKVLGGLATEDAAGIMKRNLCRNLASMREHRTGIYQKLINTPSDDRYHVVPSATGHPTVLYRHGDKRVVLSPNHRPLDGLRQVMESVKQPYSTGEAMALLGMGDGYFLKHIAKNPPPLLMDGQQVVYVIEPDAQGVLACLMMHDYAGADGPIEQKRFQWFVGEDWAEALRRRILGDGMLPLPGINVSLGINAQQMGAKVTEANRAAVEAYEQLKGPVEAIYEGLTAEKLGRKLNVALGESGVAGATPSMRVGLITTRFSTVLQYSTADMAQALEEMGFEVRVIIEPSAYHRLTRIAIRRMLAEFGPDLVIQIDHHRQEYGDLFPPGLPFVCWGQDHLPNLKNPAAGRKLGATDFLLTDAVPTYVNAYGYPRRQCIALSKLTKETGQKSCHVQPAPRPARGRGPMSPVFTAVPPEGQRGHVGAAKDAPVMSFVSNASHDPRKLLEGRLEKLSPWPSLRELAGECGRRMLGVYERGECLATFVAVRQIVRVAQQEMGLAINQAQADEMSNWLAHPFNDALYRQQALSWAARASREMSISLGLFGKGWEDHPTLGRYARGPVSYGPNLAELTRATRINLQVVPFPCVHQRLLDGVLAGGFFLIREHPVDRAMPALLDFMNRHALAAAQHSRQVLAQLDGADRQRFMELSRAVADCTKTSELDDPVEMLRCFEEARLVESSEPIVPGYDQVAFDSPTTLRERIERFLADPQAAAWIWEQQAQSIRGRFTYSAGLRRTLGQIGRLLCETGLDVHEGLAA